MLSDFLSLFFPRLCIICDITLASGESDICISCHYKLPKTYDHHQPNDLEKRFWGKVKVDRCCAYLKFHKGGITQKLLFKIKYKNKKNAAKCLGIIYGNDLLEAKLYADLIIPVPLHAHKLRTRGYNQSELFAEGLSQAMKIPLRNELIRIRKKSTQTNKSRLERWENVEGIYRIQNERNVENLHIILVDDVITTGATIEVCVNELLNAGVSKVSIVAIASAQ